MEEVNLSGTGDKSKQGNLTPADKIKQKLTKKVTPQKKSTRPKKEPKVRVNFLLEQEVIDKIQSIADAEHEGNISLVYRNIIKSSPLLNKEED